MQPKTLMLAAAAMMANLSFAQTPAVAPSAATATKPAMANAAPAAVANANAVTALCKDGSSFSGESKKGACSGHKGVKTWTSAEAVKSEMKADSAKSTTSASNTKSTTPVANGAPGGGAGKVWVNSKSNVYHCPTDRYYGKTKEGSYMSEAEAKGKGAHADHGKSCA